MILTGRVLAAYMARSSILKAEILVVAGQEQIKFDRSRPGASLP